MAAVRPAGPPPTIPTSNVGSSMPGSKAKTGPAGGGSALAERPRRKRVQEANRRAVGVGELTDANLRRHDAQAVVRMVQAEEMADLVHGHRAHRVFVQLLALMVMDRERDVGVGDDPI